MWEKKGNQAWLHNPHNIQVQPHEINEKLVSLKSRNNASIINSSLARRRILPPSLKETAEYYKAELSKPNIHK